MSKSPLFGEHQPGGVWTVSELAKHPGSIFFVCSVTGADTVGYGERPDAPVATVNYAVALCTASKGDVIYCLPGHVQTLSADGSVAISKAGVRVVGLGQGSDRPTFTCTVAAGDFKLNAASTSIDNILFINDVDQSTGMVEVSAADCRITNCEWRELAHGAKQANVYLITTDDANRLVVDGCKFNEGGATAGPATAIDIVGTDDAEIKHCYVYGDYSVGCIQVKTTAAVRLWLHDCTLWNENAVVIGIIDTPTGSTGWIGPNINIKILTDAANITAAVTGATFQMVDPVYVINAVAEQALLSTWTATTN